MGGRMTPRASSATRPGSASTEVAVASPPVAGHPSVASRRLTTKATSDVGFGTTTHLRAEAQKAVDAGRAFSNVPLSQQNP
mmetsp:Transcript_21748/g.72029  ORF Transcript_21748/g.72029 Transcript_21748/m.72029 type:complete len:81 (+) Transcript_21748:908-1150(+)